MGVRFLHLIKPLMSFIPEVVQPNRYYYLFQLIFKADCVSATASAVSQGPE